MSDVFSAIIGINPRVEPKLRKELQLTYEIFFKSGSGAGILHLTTLLEGKDGILDGILKTKDPLRLREDYNDYPNYSEEAFCGQISNLRGRLQRLNDKNGLKQIPVLFEIKDTRNKIAHQTPYLSREEFDRTMNGFLDFCRWYYENEHLPPIDPFSDPLWQKKSFEPYNLIDRRYLILRKLGGERRSQVYKVQDTKRNDKVLAVKYIGGGQAEILAQNEIRYRPQTGECIYIGGQYSSYPIGEGQYLIELEYVEGTSLAEWVRLQRENVDFPYYLMCLARQVLQGLLYLQEEKKLVHGNINAESIMVTPETDARILDFQYAGRLGNPVLNQTNLTAEDASRGLQFDQDTYSLGRCLFQCLYDEVLNPGDDFRQIELPSYLRKSVSSEMEYFIRKAVQSNPAKRFSTARIMLDEWEVAFSTLNLGPLVKSNRKDPLRNIGLVTCTRQKKQGVWPARELYKSDAFVKHLNFAEKTYNKTFIISGRYGLVDLDQQLPWYDRDLRQLTESEQEAWASFIVACLRQYMREEQMEEKRVIIHTHADELYRRLIGVALDKLGIMHRDVDYNMLPE